MPGKRHAYAAMAEYVVTCPPKSARSDFQLPVGGSAAKDRHAIVELSCSIMHARRSEQLHPVSGAVLKALSHGYSVLFHGGDSTTRASLVWLAVLRHCLVGMRLLRGKGWKADVGLRACMGHARLRCALEETYQWVPGLVPLLAEGGSHPTQALSHHQAPSHVMVHKALSEQTGSWLAQKQW